MQYANCDAVSCTEWVCLKHKVGKKISSDNFGQHWSMSELFGKGW
jgi:hypothetical protein